MARLKEWVDLAESTFRSLDSRNVTDFYSLEWTETRNRLIEEHKAEIVSERHAIKRSIRVFSALVYGLTKKLAPQRRLIFAFAEIVGIGAVVSLLARNEHLPGNIILSLVLSIGLLTLLLAMELIDKIKFRDELELARDLQADILPKELPSLAGFDLAAYNRIANTVGGDIYDFVALPDGRMAILFGDASGHGMAAGLVMAVAHAAFRTQLDVDPAPRPVFAALNRILCRTGGPRSFFAGLYFLLEADGRFQTMIAGHPPILRFDRGGRQCESIGRGAYPLGIKSSTCWQVEEGHLKPGEMLIFHSDGLVEARGPGDEVFGYDRVGFVVGRSGNRAPVDVVADLVSEHRMFTIDRPPDDDISIAVIRRS